MKTNKVKSVISLIISFITMFVIIITAILSLLSLTILNSKFIPNIIDKTNYSDLLYININSEIQHILGVSGIPEDVSKDLVTIGDVAKDSNDYFVAIFSGETSKLDTSSLKEKIKKSIDDYAFASDLTNVNKKELEKNIVELVDKSVQIYENHILVKTIQPIGEVIKIFNDFRIFVFLFILVVLFILLLIIVLINRNAEKVIKNYTFSALGANLFLLVSALAIEISNLVSRIPITNQSQYVLATATLTTMITYLWYIIGMLFALSFILIVVYIAIIKNKKLS